MTADGIMTKDHPRWDKFIGYLVEACDLHQEGNDLHWRCQADYTYSRLILRGMGMDVESTLGRLRGAHIHCDCGVLLVNIGTVFSLSAEGRG